MKDLVFASGNAGKLREVSQILEPLGWSVHSQGEFFQSEVEETALTFVENALLKARYACAKTGRPALADDSGLEVPALQGAPGIYSSRYAGEHATDADNVTKLLQHMEDVPACMRQASFYCAMVFCRHEHDPTPIIALGRWTGEILHEPSGEGGFGYDPVFFVPEEGKSAAQLDKETKNRLSHRGQALTELVKQLQESL